MWSYFLKILLVFHWLFQYPERVFPSEYGVTAVNFSNYNSNLLAVSDPSFIFHEII